MAGAHSKMDYGLKNKIAIVAGGSKGIGFATARMLVREGARVVIAGRTKSSLDIAVATLSSEAPDRVHGFCADLTVKANVERATEETKLIFGTADIAICNAGALDTDRDGAGPAHFAGTPPNEFTDEFKQMGLSAWYLARAVMPDMKAKRWGRIFSIASSSAREPKWELPHVLPNTVRPAVAGLFRSLAQTAYADGITVNSILTGSIATERWREYHTWLAGERGISLEQLLAERFAAIPAGRPGTPEEMAGLMLFLCSSFADCITGQSIPVTGGRSRHVY
jgi:3-oxoacyl-[acyl-carrier protein] reductase